MRFCEHGTPFDRSLDDTIVDEDILVTLGDEAFGYFSDETDDESDELKQDFVDENVDATIHRYLISGESSGEYDSVLPGYVVYKGVVGDEFFAFDLTSSGT